MHGAGENADAYVPHVLIGWLVGFVSEAITASSQLGVEVVASSGFSLNDPSGIEKAVSLVAESGARVTLCIVFPADLEVILEVADGLGLLSTGYAWVTSQQTLEALLSGVADPARTSKQLAGLLEMQMDLLDGPRGPRFHQVLHNTLIENLDNRVFGDVLTEALIKKDPCDGYCATIYDAVWTAAIAMSRMELAED
eukprot:2935513-Rhodomonas_salina.1